MRWEGFKAGLYFNGGMRRVEIQIAFSETTFRLWPDIKCHPKRGLLLMKHRNRGFGGGPDIERLVLICGFSILLAIVAPAFFDYRTRAAVSDALEASEPLRVCIGRSIAKEYRPLPTKDMERKFKTQLVDGKLIEKITMGADGTIELQFGERVRGAIGSTLVLTAVIRADQPIKWVCTGGTLEQCFRPDDCKPEEPSR